MWLEWAGQLINLDYVMEIAIGPVYVTHDDSEGEVNEWGLVFAKADGEEFQTVSPSFEEYETCEAVIAQIARAIERGEKVFKIDEIGEQIEEHE